MYKRQRGDRAAFADDALDLEGSLHVLGIGHAVGNDGGFERHDGLAGGKGLGKDVYKRQSSRSMSSS